MSRRRYRIHSSIINLEELRRRRMDPSRNFPALLRNEVYRKIYEAEIYPANQFIGGSARKRIARDPRLTIEEFVRKGIYQAPEHMPGD